jgi:hypothetical protein
VKPDTLLAPVQSLAPVKPDTLLAPVKPDTPFAPVQSLAPVKPGPTTRHTPRTRRNRGRKLANDQACECIVQCGLGLSVEVI